MSCFTQGGGKERTFMKNLDLAAQKFPNGVTVEIAGAVKGTAENVKVDGNGLDAVAAAYSIITKGKVFDPEVWEITPKKMSLLPSAHLKIQLKKKSAAK